MKIILDACSIINLVNATGLEACAGLERCELYVGPIVFGECSEGSAQELISLINSGRILQLPDDEIPIDTFLDMLAEHNLGEGETECIAGASISDFIVCSDDGRARYIGRTLLGQNRVIGSARLLKWCVEEDILICTEASSHFSIMKDMGGFLPTLADAFFCPG